MLTSLIGLAVMFKLLSQTVDYVPEHGGIREEQILATTPPIEVVEGSFKRNSTFVATLIDFDIPSDLAHKVASLIQPIFDVRGIRSGQSFKLEKDADGTLRAFEYKISEDKVLEVQREGDSTDSYEARVSTLELESRDSVVSAAITAEQNSLYAALEAQEGGQAVQLAEKVASIFAWDVDFNTDVQVNDTIRIVVPALYYEGEFVKWGDVQAAELVNSGKTYQAFRFEGSFYDARGNALKRAFLASPLPFNPRITSGYSRARLHPILGRARPHLAVDYGAPTGTPVQAIANGTVTSAGWHEGYGNLVQIRHTGGLSTGYAHLSTIAAGVRPGAKISQGDPVGKVGATGLATGPHLHYMMSKNGQPINPLKMKSEPAIPLDPKLLPAFKAFIAPLEARLSPPSGIQSAAK